MVRGNGPSFAASVRLSWPFQMGFTVLSYPPTTPIHTSTKSTDIYHIFSYPHTTPIYISSKSTDIHHIFSYPPTTPIHSSIKSADIYHIFSYPATTPIHTSTKATDIYHIFSYPPTTPIYTSTKSAEIYHIISYHLTTPIHTSTKSTDISPTFIHTPATLRSLSFPAYPRPCTLWKLVLNGRVYQDHFIKPNNLVYLVWMRVLNIKKRRSKGVNYDKIHRVLFSARYPSPITLSERMYVWSFSWFSRGYTSLLTHWFWKTWAHIRKIVPLWMPFELHFISI